MAGTSPSGERSSVRRRDTVSLLDGGAEAFPRMLRALAAARSTVRLEVYAFALDDVGHPFVEALAAAARRGVRVTVVLDGWGSVADGSDIVDRLREAGCNVALYNPIASALAGRFTRNHRKLLMVDEDVAFLGGINIGEEYGRIDEHDAPYWLDLAVEVRGAAVAWLGRRLRGDRGPPPAGPVRIHLSGIGGGRRLRRRYLTAIASARKRVVVAHAYFLPDRSLVRTITAAARRGVEVSLVLPGRSDVPLARSATRSLYGKLLRGGVRIYEWSESVLHAKAALTDDRRLLVGSFNLDPFSLANLESLVEVDDPEVARRAASWMDRTIARAQPVTAEGLAAHSRIVRWVLDALGLLALRLAHRIGRLLALRPKPRS